MSDNKKNVSKLIYQFEYGFVVGVFGISWENPFLLTCKLPGSWIFPTLTERLFGELNDYFP